MKKITLLIISFCLSVNASAFASTIVNIIDISGSTTDCEDTLSKNLAVVNKTIDSLIKNDRFTVVLYSSQQPIKAHDYTMPETSGGRNKHILSAREEIRRQLASKLENIFKDSKKLKKVVGEASDCLGAILYASILTADLENPSKPIVIHHFSDGLHNVNIGKIPQGNEEYLRLLKEKFAKTNNIPSLHADELVWYGSICKNSGSLSEIAEFELQLKKIWSDFLKNKVPSMRYILDY
jgi:hypothetical protein